MCGTSFTSPSLCSKLSLSAHIRSRGRRDIWHLFARTTASYEGVRRVIVILTALGARRKQLTECQAMVSIEFWQGGTDPRYIVIGGVGHLHMQSLKPRIRRQSRVEEEKSFCLQRKSFKTNET
jgi:putative NADH-flavin reductase